MPNKAKSLAVNRHKNKNGNSLNNTAEGFHAEENSKINEITQINDGKKDLEDNEFEREDSQAKEINEIFTDIETE